ncbi:hypothetical protein D3C72_1569330 [compost metagenome]
MARSTSDTLVLPLAFNSLAVMTCTALAPSFSLTRIFDPVTLTRSMSSSAWAMVETAGKAAAMARLMASGLNMVSSYWDCSLFPIKKAEQGHADRVGQRANDNETDGVT